MTHTTAWRTVSVAPLIGWHNVFADPALPYGWRLDPSPALLLQERTMDGQRLMTRVVYATSDSDGEIGPAKDADGYLASAFQRPEWTREELVNWLDRRVDPEGRLPRAAHVSGLIGAR